jgi:ubiquitin-like modifier-activating enzyme ATG7
MTVISKKLKKSYFSENLFLKLIRWRQAPSIDLDKFTALRVLLVGSGTLGCNLARALLVIL